MQIIINLIIKFFTITLIGLLLKKKGFISEGLEKGLNQLLIRLILPVNILASSQREYFPEAAGNMLLTAAFAAGYYLVSIIISNVVSRISPMDGKERKIFIITTVFANVGFIGFPVAGELYGSEGILYAVIYNICYQMSFFTYGVGILNGVKRFTPKALLKNPVTVCSIVSVLIFLIQFKMPAGIASALTSVGDMTAPVSLILIGCSLSSVKIKEILTDKYSYLVSFFRMILYPVMVFLILRLLRLPAAAAGTCAVLTALPSGSLAVIYAQENGCSPRFASRAVIQTMLFMIITLPLMLVMVSLYL